MCGGRRMSWRVAAHTERLSHIVRQDPAANGDRETAAALATAPPSLLVQTFAARGMVDRYLRGNSMDAYAIYLRLAATVGGDGVGGKVSHLSAASAGRAARTEGLTTNGTSIFLWEEVIQAPPSGTCLDQCFHMRPLAPERVEDKAARSGYNRSRSISEDRDKPGLCCCAPSAI